MDFHDWKKKRNVKRKNKMVLDDLPRLFDHTYSTFERPRRKRKLPTTYRGSVRRCIEFPNGVFVTKNGCVKPVTVYTNCIPVDDHIPDDNKYVDSGSEPEESDDSDFVPEEDEDEEEESSSSDESVSEDSEDTEDTSDTESTNNVIETPSNNDILPSESPTSSTTESLTTESSTTESPTANDESVNLHVKEQNT